MFHLRTKMPFRSRFPTAATQVRSWISSCGICGGQSRTAAGFLPVHRFPLTVIRSNNCSTVFAIYHQGLVQKAINGSSNSRLRSIQAPQANKKNKTRFKLQVLRSILRKRIILWALQIIFLLFVYSLGWSGTLSTVTEANYWAIFSALDNR
jgi:hypothetical protein